MNIQPLTTLSEYLVGLLDHEHAVAAIKARHVAGLQSIPRAVANSPRQHCIEHCGARRRERKTALHPIVNGLLTAEHSLRASQIATIDSKALRPEIVRNAMCGDEIDAFGQFRAVACKVTDHNIEVIALQRATLEFAPVPHSIDYLKPISFDAHPVRAHRRSHRQGE
jgi:hypothetical protein